MSETDEGFFISKYCLCVCAYVLQRTHTELKDAQRFNVINTQRANSHKAKKQLAVGPNIYKENVLQTEEKKNIIFFEISVFTAQCYKNTKKIK